MIAKGDEYKGHALYMMYLTYCQVYTKEATMGTLTKPQERRLDAMRRAHHDMSILGVNGAGVLTVSTPRVDGGSRRYTIGRGGKLTMIDRLTSDEEMVELP